jgi:hypothetical protein
MPGRGFIGGEKFQWIGAMPALRRTAPYVATQPLAVSCCWGWKRRL